MNKKITTSLVASFFLATTNLYSQELSEITVTSATKSEQSIKDVTSNVEVITKEEIEERHYTTVAEVLNNLAGIDVISNGGIGKSVSVFMRGFDSQRILVLVDGIRYNDFTGISGARFENLMINDIKQIEIIKGAQSGIWGSDASAGVINIITSNTKKGFNSNINVEVGSFNTKKIQTTLSNKNEKYDFKLSLTKLVSDSFTSRAANGVSINSYEKDGYDNTTLNVKSGYNLDDNNRVELKYEKIKTKTDYDSSLTNQNGYSLYTNNDFASINLTNKNKFSIIKTYYNYTKIDKDDPKGWTKTFDGRMDEFGINVNVPYNKNSFVLFGIDLNESNHKNESSKKIENHGYFLTNSTKLKNTIFTQSIRYDEYNSFNNKFTGKIGIRQNYSNDLYITSNYGIAYNVPTIYKLYNTFYGDSNLQPEETKSFDFTLGYKNTSITYFKSKISNMIDFNSGTWKYTNLAGNTNLEGIEIGFKKDISTDLLLSANYIYTSAKDNNNVDLERRAEQSFKFAFDYYGIDKFHFNLNGEYVGKRYEYAYGTYNINANTGNYVVLNNVINYDLNLKTKLYLKIDNILNRYYQTINGYATAPRSFYVGLKYKF